ncbi:MAG: Ig-like domain-containing protein, partial [Patescibacteria group bacterium]
MLKEQIGKKLIAQAQTMYRTRPTLSILGTSIACAALIAITVLWIGPGTEAQNVQSRQSVAATSPLRLSFPALMNKESVERLLQWPSGVRGSTSWEGNTLVITPERPLVYEREYIFTIPAGTQTIEDRLLEERYSVVFTVDKAPSIAFFAPENDAKDVIPSQPVTVMFDRAMVPMDALLPNAKTSPGAFPRMEPPVPGEWKWITTSTAVFTPAQGFAKATAYTITVPKGTRTASGEQTPNDFQWRFETERPKLIGSAPAHDAKRVRPDEPIRLTFSQPVDAESLRKALALHKTGKKAKIIPISRLEYGDGKKSGSASASGTSFTIVPVEPLELYGAYEVEIASGVKAAAGPLASADSARIAFTTIDDFHTLNVTSDKYHGFIVQLSSPVDLAVAKEHIIVTREDGSPVPFLLGTGESSSFAVSFKPEYERTYTIAIREALQDIYGRKLKNGERTERLYVPPLPARLTVEHDNGFTVVPSGERPRVDITATNVFEMGASFGRVPLEQLAIWYSQQFERELEKPDTQKFRMMWMKTGIPPNKEWQQAFLNLPGLSDDNKFARGAYIYTFIAPGIRRWNSNKPEVFTRFFNVTDLVLSAKITGAGVSAWLVERASGKAVPNAAVKIVDGWGHGVGKGQTDSSGMATIPVDLRALFKGEDENSETLWISAATADDVAIINHTVYRGGTKAPEEETVFTLRTDRPVYRPGETVLFSGFVRKRETDRSLDMARQSRFIASLSSGSGKDRLKPVTVAPDAFGGFHGEFVLPEDAALGSYSLRVMPPVASKKDRFVGNSVSLQVLEFRKPEFRIASAFTDTQLTDDGAVALELDATYLFGSPVAGAKVSWSLTAFPQPISLPKAAGFTFEDQQRAVSFPPTPSACPYCSMMNKKEGTAMLDAAGKARIRVPWPELDAGKAWRLALAATVTSADSHSLTAKSTAVATPNRSFTGIRMHELAVESGAKLRVDVTTVVLSGDPLPRRAVRIGFTAQGRRRSEGGAIPEPRMIETDDTGKASVLLDPLPPGKY